MSKINLDNIDIDDIKAFSDILYINLIKNNRLSKNLINPELEKSQKSKKKENAKRKKKEVIFIYFINFRIEKNYILNY